MRCCVRPLVEDPMRTEKVTVEFTIGAPEDYFVMGWANGFMASLDSQLAGVPQLREDDKQTVITAMELR